MERSLDHCIVTARIPTGCQRKGLRARKSQFICQSCLTAEHKPNWHFVHDSQLVLDYPHRSDFVIPVAVCNSQKKCGFANGRMDEYEFRYRSYGNG